MSRVLLLTSFILLQFCSDGLADEETSIEVDGLEGLDRGTDVEDDNINEKVKMLGVDYFGGGQDRDSANDDFKLDNLNGSPENQYPDSIELLNSNRDKQGRGEIVILDSMDTRNYKAEVKAGNKADVLGVNPHYYQPDVYPDFSRRFVLQYPYTEIEKTNIGVVKPNSLTPKLVAKKNVNVVKPNSLTPKLVSPELFMAVAQKSVLLAAARPKGAEDEFVRKDILRNGDYWNAVWKEDVDPLVLRTKQTKKLESIKAEIPPGSKLYDLLYKLKHLSPTLLYVINERDS